MSRGLFAWENRILKKHKNKNITIQDNSIDTNKHACDWLWLLVTPKKHQQQKKTEIPEQDKTVSFGQSFWWCLINATWQQYKYKKIVHWKMSILSWSNHHISKISMIFFVPRRCFCRPLFSIQWKSYSLKSFPRWHVHIFKLYLNVSMKSIFASLESKVLSHLQITDLNISNPSSRSESYNAAKVIEMYCKGCIDQFCDTFLVLFKTQGLRSPYSFTDWKRAAWTL